MNNKFTTTLTFEEYLSASWLVWLNQWFWSGVLKFIGFMSVLFFSIGFFFMYLRNDINFHSIVAEVAIGLMLATITLGFVGLVSLWSIPRTVRKTYKQLGIFTIPTMYEFGEAGIHISSSISTSNLDWPHIHSWIENDKVLLLLITHANFFCISKSQTDDDVINALKKALVNGSVKENRLFK